MWNRLKHKWKLFEIKNYKELAYIELVLLSTLVFMVWYKYTHGGM
jgi:hypothetical protein